VTACPLCKSPHTRPGQGDQPILPGHRSFYRCTACRTVFMAPMPDADALAEYYDDDYYGEGSGKFIGPVESIVRLCRYMRAKAIARYVPRGRILDVGCGRGLTLQYLKDRGYEVDGVELDTVAAVRASKNLNQAIFTTLDEVVGRLPRQYEAVCFWHSLEHLSDPKEALEAVGRLLAPGGFLIIAAPHVESLQSRLSGRFWLHLDIPRHLVHFDMKRLAMFLQDKGYRLVREQHFCQEHHVIDTLCYLYTTLGFHHLYPFDLIRNIKGHGACRKFNPIETVLGLALLLPLTGMAFFVSNFFSMLGAGSTVTLFLQKISPYAP